MLTATDDMNLRKTKVLRGFNRFRLMLTLGLAVLLPTAGLIYLNFSQLMSFERDKVLEAAIHRDFQEMLAIGEKKINKKVYTMAEEVRGDFPSPDAEQAEKEKRLDSMLSRYPAFSHIFLFDGKNMVFRSQPQLLNDKYFREEHEKAAQTYHGWFSIEGKSLVAEMHKKPKPYIFYTATVKRAEGEVYASTVLFTLPKAADDRPVMGGATFDPLYLKQTFFPQALEQLISEKLTDQGGNRLAMMVYPAETEGGHEMKPLAASTGWGEGKPEVMRKLDGVFVGSPLVSNFRARALSSWVRHGCIAAF